MIHTAEVEHQRRFIASKPISIPDDDFVRYIYKSLQACLNTSNTTQTIRAVFVQGEGLPLQVAYSKGEGIVRIHQNWLSQEELRFRLRLGIHRPLPDVILLTSVTLLKEVIDQLPGELFWNGKAHELHLTEQKLLEYTRTYINSGILSADSTPPSGGKLADITWENCSPPKPHVQINQTSDYSELQKHVPQERN
ncbi:hypothetical protein ACHAP5_002850 [Fusarium lateritium]